MKPIATLKSGEKLSIAIEIENTKEGQLIWYRMMTAEEYCYYRQQLLEPKWPRRLWRWLRRLVRCNDDV